jgi:hypothetical protein
MNKSIDRSATVEIGDELDKGTAYIYYLVNILDIMLVLLSSHKYNFVWIYKDTNYIANSNSYFVIKEL